MLSRRSVQCATLVIVGGLCALFPRPAMAAAVAMYWPGNPFPDAVEGTVALTAFSAYLGTKANVGGELKTSFFKKAEDFDSFGKSESLALALLDPASFLARQETLGLVPVGLALQDNSVQLDYVVAVSRDSPAKSLADLRDKSVSASASDATSLKLLSNWTFWGEIDVGKFFSAIKSAESASSAVLAVVYRTADAAITPLSNPVLKQNVQAGKVRVLVHLHRTVDLVASCSSGAMDAQAIQRVRAALLEMSTAPEGRKVLDKLGIQGWQTDGVSLLVEDVRQAVKKSAAELYPRPLEVVAVPLDSDTMEKPTSPFVLPWTLRTDASVLGLSTAQQHP
ncbi:MAG: PhnD/SsuA/transferrin family substrate-binding protein [Candidatus Schekmanbacteria bacterium]|nr:PhnD/SsuA/transferrin family substrate-binding protein [Candidatus Schekmanbacteria bacterium]